MFQMLMVFSRSFAASKWCQFELVLCLQHAMDTHDHLLLLVLDDVIDTRNVMTSAMMAVLKTTTYLQWRKDDKDVQRAFWGRIKVALTDIIQQ